MTQPSMGSVRDRVLAAKENITNAISPCTQFLNSMRDAQNQLVQVTEGTAQDDAGQILQQIEQLIGSFPEDASAQIQELANKCEEMAARL